MHSQQQVQNVLFAAAPLSPVAQENAGSSLPSPHVKRPLPIFVKSSRSARLGAAAAAAVAACGAAPAADSDAGGDDCMLSPAAASGAASANGLIYSLLGSMPALPGSPTLDSPETPAPAASRLLKQSSAFASFRGRVGSGGPLAGCSGTGGTQTDPGGAGPRLAKCMSDRARGSAGGRGGSGGAASAVYDEAAASVTLHALRALARKSVDAAAGAELLATRQVSELPLAAAEAQGAATATAAAAPHPLPSTFQAATVATASAARPRVGSGPAPPPGATTSPSGGGSSSGGGSTAAAFGAVATSRLRDWSSVSAASRRPSAAAAEDPLTHGSHYHPSQSKPAVREWQQREGLLGRPGSAATTAATAAAVTSTEGPTGAGRPRGTQSDVRHWPRWLERLLKALHVDTAHRYGKGGGGGGGSVDGRRDAGGDDGSGGGHPAAVARTGGGGDGGSSTNELLAGGSDGRRSSGDMGRGDGDGENAGGSGGGGDGGTADDEDSGVRPVAPSRGGSGGGGGARDALMSASRLLSSRLNRRPRPDVAERLPSVMASRDSTTVHRARLAHQAKAPHTLLTASPSARQPGLSSPQAAQYGRGTALREVALATPITNASAAAAATGVSVTARVRAAAAAAAAASSKTTAVNAEAFASNSSVESRHVRLHAPTLNGSRGGDHVRPRSGGGGGRGSRSLRRLRQVSAPGAAEPRFTPLNQLDTRSVDGAADAAAGGSDAGAADAGAAAAAEAAAADSDSDSCSCDDDDRSLQVALRMAAMTVRR